MHDPERALLSRCVSGGLIETLVSRGIAARHFEDEKHRAVYQTMVDHMSTYGAPPSKEAVLASHPTYQLDIVTDSIDYLIDRFTGKVQRTEAKRAVLDLAAAIDQGAGDYDTLFMEYTERVAQAIPTSRVSRLSDAPTRLDLFKQMQATGKIPGVPFGLPTIDSVVLGVQKHELVVISAPSSIGKSTLLMFVALACYLNDPSHRPCFISLEMEGDALLRKWDAMAVNFEYRALKALELGEGDLRRWEQWGERVREAPNDILVIDDISECTVERVYAEMLRWKPSAMFVDYFGIMTPTQNRQGDAWQGMAAMAKALKRVPRRTLIPLFTAAQTNRQGFKEGVKGGANIADTVEIFRSADIMLDLWRDEDEDPKKMTCTLAKNRDGRRNVSVDVLFDMEYMRIHEDNHFGRKTSPSALALPPIEENPFARVEAA